MMALTKNIALVLVLGPALLAQSALITDPNTVFGYDATKPLNYKEAKTESVGNAEIVEISYDSPKLGRVPAYLVVPVVRGNKKRAGIIYMHWGQGNKTEFLAEALEMAGRGAVSIMIDAPYWRSDVPGFEPNADAAKERDVYVQLVVDLRRAVDVLVARADIDAKRIGYVGHSLGATWGGPLAAVEKRVKVLVLMGGLPSLTNYDDDSFFAAVQRSATPRDKFERWAKVIEPINPEHFAGLTGPAKVYFQWARYDMYISRRSAEEYYSATGGPKEQHWYLTSHEFNDSQSHRDRIGWLTQELLGDSTH